MSSDSSRAGKDTCDVRKTKNKGHTIRSIYKTTVREHDLLYVHKTVTQVLASFLCDDANKTEPLFRMAEADIYCGYKFFFATENVAWF